MVNHRLDRQDAEQRLSQFPVLASVLGPNWFAQEYSKPIEQWSLITGWVSRIDDNIFGNQFEKWLKDLDAALKSLKNSHLSTTAWQKLERKVRSHSDRTGFKGTMSEIAMCRFLAAKRFPLDLEIKLVPQSNKDVDVRITMPNSVMLHIEVQLTLEN